MAITYSKFRLLIVDGRTVITIKIVRHEHRFVSLIRLFIFFFSAEQATVSQRE